MPDFIAGLKRIADKRRFQIAVQPIDCFVLYSFHRPRHMAMIPTDEVIAPQARGCGDAQGVGLASLGQNTGFNVAPGERFHRFADRIYGVMGLLDAALHFSRIGGSRIFHFGEDHVRDRARGLRSVQQS